MVPEVPKDPLTEVPKPTLVPTIRLGSLGWYAPGPGFCLKAPSDTPNREPIPKPNRGQVLYLLLSGGGKSYVPGEGPVSGLTNVLFGFIPKDHFGDADHFE